MNSILIVLAVILLAAPTYAEITPNGAKSDFVIQLEGYTIRTVAQHERLTGEDASGHGLPDGIEVTSIRVTADQNTDLTAQIDCAEQPNAWGTRIAWSPITPNSPTNTYLIRQGVATVRLFDSHGNDLGIKIIIDTQTTATIAE